MVRPPSTAASEKNSFEVSAQVLPSRPVLIQSTAGRFYLAFAEAPPPVQAVVYRVLENTLSLQLDAHMHVTVLHNLCPEFCATLKLQEDISLVRIETQDDKIKVPLQILQE